MTTPILSYNCEIWGANQKQDLKRGTAPQLKKPQLQLKYF